MTSTKERGRLRRSGMGGFLNPPGHPEHDWSIETDLRRRPENRGSMSLSAAVTAEYLDDATRADAKRMLDVWTANRMPLESQEVQAWIRQVLGYFKGCYRNPEASAEQWHAGKLIIDRERNPMDAPEAHAGVNLIRRYYPEYVPTAEHFASAKWGN